MSALDLFAAPSRSSLNLMKTVHGMISLSRSRRALAKLDTDALNDIGVDLRSAQVEAKRTAWDVPQNWRF